MACSEKNQIFQTNVILLIKTAFLTLPPMGGPCDPHHYILWLRRGLTGENRESKLFDFSWLCFADVWAEFFCRMHQASFGDVRCRRRHRL